METLLIEPPQGELGNISRFFGSFGTSKAKFVWPPIELMSIAGYIRQFGIKPIIYDAGGTKKNLEETKKAVSELKPEVVIFSTSTTTIYSDLDIATLVKEISPKTLTVAVGSHVMALPEETLKLNKNLDVAIYNDDEEVVVKNLTESKKDLSEIKGICYRDSSGRIKRNPPQNITNNLDELGFPAHDLINKDLYYDFMTKDGNAPAFIMAQRGCINKCTFCNCPALYRYRERSIPHVIEELKWIKNLGYKEFKFINAGISYNPKWINALLDEMIKNNLNLSWWTNARADKLTDELLLKMKKAGCHTLAIGMESADPEILKNIGKNITPEQVKKAVFLIKRAGMKVAVYFIFGLPGETKETMKKSIKFAKSLPADFVTMGVAQPLPGTKFYDHMKEKKYLITDDWSKYDPVNLPVYEYPHLSKKEIYEATRSGYRQFYLRPSYILKKTLEIKSFKDFQTGLINFAALIRRYVLKNPAS